MQLKVVSTEQNDYADIDLRRDELRLDEAATWKLIEKVREAADAAERELRLGVDAESFCHLDAAVFLSLKALRTQLGDACLEMERIRQRRLYM